MKDKIRYTVRYKYAGICQYADFVYVDGKLVMDTFSPLYTNGDEIPSLEGLNELTDILPVIEVFTGRKAEIYMVNGDLADYHTNQYAKEAITNASSKYAEFISSLVSDFFMSVLYPIIVKNGWKISHSWMGKPILVEMRDGEWDNVKSSDIDVINFEYICHKFCFNVLGHGQHTDLRVEQESYLIIDSFSKLSIYLDDDKLRDMGILITLN